MWNFEVETIFCDQKSLKYFSIVTCMCERDLSRNANRIQQEMLPAKLNLQNSIKVIQCAAVHVTRWAPECHLTQVHTPMCPYEGQTRPKLQISTSHHIELAYAATPDPSLHPGNWRLDGWWVSCTPTVSVDYVLYKCNSIKASTSLQHYHPFSSTFSWKCTQKPFFFLSRTFLYVWKLAAVYMRVCVCVCVCVCVKPWFFTIRKSCIHHLFPTFFYYLVTLVTGLLRW